ncbi:WD40-repeat-containing domain protein [Syncephalis fuscata]|nr:WD40-repeat-containing domain protein [Syncephalis fuscata]
MSLSSNPTTETTPTAAAPVLDTTAITAATTTTTTLPATVTTIATATATTTSTASTTTSTVPMMPDHAMNAAVMPFNMQGTNQPDDRSMDVDELERLMMGDPGDDHGGFDLTNDIDMDALANSGFFSNFSGFMGSDAQLSHSLPAQVLRPKATLSGHTNKVATCTFSTSGRWLASAGHDKKVMIWSSTGGQLQHTLTGHSGHINSARFSPDTRDLLVTASYDKTVRVWHAINGPQPECAITYSGHQGSVTAVDFCPVPNSDQCYSVDAEGELQVWSMLMVYAPRPLNYNPMDRPSIPPILLIH